MTHVTVEICVDTPDGLAAAIAGGADRIELCSALPLGGLTPSPGLMRMATKAAVPVYAMIRPREGDFAFSPAEIDQMRRDIDAARAAGLAGIVIGASEPRGRLDAEVLLRLATHARGMGTTLHRAFDLVPDRHEALDIAVSLGFERILTAGGGAAAMDALPVIAELVQRAGDRISIMPGGGVRSGNATDVLRETGAHELHASCGAPGQPVSPEALRLGFGRSPTLTTTSEEGVALLVAAALAFRNRTE